MIAEGFEFRAVQRLSAGDLQAVFAFFHLRSHRAQVRGDGGDAVRFLHAQLFRIAHLDSLLRIRSDRSQHRNLVDQRGGIGSGDGRAFQPPALDLQRAHQLAVDSHRVE